MVAASELSLQRLAASSKRATDAVPFCAYKDWKIDADGLIAGSRGHFDDAEYQQRLEHGVGAGRQAEGHR